MELENERACLIICLVSTRSFEWLITLSSTAWPAVSYTLSGPESNLTLCCFLHRWNRWNLIKCCLVGFPWFEKRERLCFKGLPEPQLSTFLVCVPWLWTCFNWIPCRWYWARFWSRSNSAVVLAAASLSMCSKTACEFKGKSLLLLNTPPQTV